MLGSETQSTLFWLFGSGQTLQRPLQGRAARAPLAGLGRGVQMGTFGKSVAQRPPGFSPSCPLQPRLPSPHPSSHRLPGVLELRGRPTSWMRTLDDHVAVQNHTRRFTWTFGLCGPSFSLRPDPANLGSHMQLICGVFHD